MRHLDLLNAFLALRFRQPGYPACLQDLGYSLQSIGVTVRLADKTAVAPDLITSRLECDVTLIVEVKGGRAVDLHQLRRMQRLQALELRDYAYLSIRNPGSHRVQVVYICNEDDRAAIAADLGNEPVALIGFDGTRFRRSGVPLIDPDLDACLGRAEVASESVPLAIIPFDRESPPEEIARAVAPHIVDAWLRGSGTIQLDSLIARTHHLVHEAMSSTGSGSEIREVRLRARQVIDSLAKAELADLLEPMGSQPPAWRFKRGPPDDSSRTRELQKLQRALERYLESVGSRRAVQLDLGLPEPTGST